MEGKEGNGDRGQEGREGKGGREKRGKKGLPRFGKNSGYGPEDEVHIAGKVEIFVMCEYRIF